MTSGASDFVVNREDYHKCKFVEAPAPDDIELRPGQVLIRVDCFAFTANNITYAAFGDVIGYWNFFPAEEEGWGRVPVWGFGEVLRSECDGIQVGERLYGYYPMSTYLVVRPDKVTVSDFVDCSAHRKPLPPVYNQYRRVGADPVYDPEHEAEQMLFYPLFMTSFVLDDFLADNDFFGAKKVILSSASSKTAMGLAFLLSQNRKGKCDIVGLTSKSNEAFVKSLGCYDQVVTYDDLASLGKDDPVVYVDFAGNGSLRRDIHMQFGDKLVYDCAVGGTHWEERAPSENLPGAPTIMFFAPDQIRKRNADWGPEGLQERFGGAWQSFLKAAAGWISIERGEGQSEVEKIYLETLDGKARPDTGHILRV